jgi:hypothetical protein
MNKLLAAINVLRRGSAVADPALWKKGGIALQVAITAFLLSLNSVAKAFGHDLQLSPQTAGEIATGLVAVVGVLFTVITTDKIGILPAKPEVPADPAASVQAEMDVRGGP